MSGPQGNRSQGNVRRPPARPGKEAAGGRRRQGAPPVGIRFEVGHLSNKGRVREANEDNYGIPSTDPTQAAARQQRGDLYLVADGMGGYQGGATASRLAAEVILNSYYSDPNPNLAQSLKQAIERANMAIHQKSFESEVLSKMGTTVVAALLLRDGRVIFANVGDSRGYIVNAQGQATQATQDHSWVEEQVRLGVLTPEQARTHPQRNVITRSLGQKDEVEVDIYPPRPLHPGESVVLCSDGLSGQVTKEEIGEAVTHEPPQQAVERLVALANERGGPDNITVVVAEANWEDTAVC